MAKKNNPKPLPKISIVMPSFNSVDYIERSIRSIVEQKYSNLELFIKDAGSTDGTLDIIRYYAKKHPKIIRWVSCKDRGQADAINFGIKQVTGDILAYLNADDVYKPGALKVVGEYFAKNKKIMWAYGKCDVIKEDDQPTRGFITGYKNFWLKRYSYLTLLILNYISQMACFWRREATEEIGYFDEEQYYVMDYDYWLRLGKKYHAGVINQYLASFRMANTTKSARGFIQQFIDEFAVAKKYTGNPLIVFLHKFHYYLIIVIYTILKIIDNKKAAVIH